MTTQIERPEIYHIKHPLSDQKASDQVLASYSDEDLAEYRSEYEEYRRVQSDATTQVGELCNDARQYFKVLFGDDSKQHKYLERSIRNGETYSDQHARRYPRPQDVEAKVQEARGKYCNFLSQDNAPKVSGDDTLQEINNAVTFLMEKELVMNTDFTISNAVSLAQSMASEDLDDRMEESENGVAATEFNLTIKDVSNFPSDKYSLYSDRGYIRLRCDEMDYEPEGKLAEADGNYLNYSVSFAHSSKPTYNLCVE